VAAEAEAQNAKKRAETLKEEARAAIERGTELANVRNLASRIATGAVSIKNGSTNGPA
jgi:hypothetical protein